MGRILYYDKTGPSWESAAEFFSAYWSVNYTALSEHKHIAPKKDMPNHYKWAEQWFGR